MDLPAGTAEGTRLVGRFAGNQVELGEAAQLRDDAGESGVRVAGSSGPVILTVMLAR